MTQLETKQQEIASLKAKLMQADQDRQQMRADLDKAIETAKLSHYAAVKLSKDQSKIDEKILALHESQLKLMEGLSK